RPLNDEYSHYKYVTFLIKEHRLPANQYIHSIRDPIAWIFQDFEYAQPPLYYILNVPFALLPNPIFACRLFSVVLGIGTLWFVLLCALQVSRFREQIAIVVSILVGFHPVFLRIGSSISNDNLAWFLSAFLFWLLLSESDLSHKYIWGFVMGAGILTKVSFLIWPLFLLILTVYQILREPKSRKAGITNLFVALILSLGLASWLFARNVQLYGDWSGMAGGSGKPGAILLSGDPRILQDFAEQSIRYFFFPIAEENTALLSVCTAIVVFFCVGLFFQYQKIKDFFLEPRYFLYCVLFTLLNIALYVQSNLYWNLFETRHLFIGIVPLAILAADVLISIFPLESPGVAAAMQVVSFTRLS